MGRSKFAKGSRDMHEKHGETCQCRRCRARSEALDRRSLKIRSTEYARYVSRTSEDEK